MERCYEGSRSDSAANDAEVIASCRRMNDQLSIAAGDQKVMERRTHPNRKEPSEANNPTRS